MAKSHICSPGKLTVPRLELEAALDAVKLFRMVNEGLDLRNCQSYFWSDSTIVLQSLRASSKKFPTFSRTRLQKILTHTNACDWNFVGTKVNPADKLTRGMSAKQLLRDKLWFEGPEFLKLSPELWPILPHKPPSGEIFKCYDNNLSSAKTTAVSLNAISDKCCQVKPTSVFIISFSSLYRLTVATSWLVRYKQFLSSRVKNTEVPHKLPISATELNEAELYLIRYVQRESFASEMACIKGGKPPPTSSPLRKLNLIVVEDVLRVSGRLANSPLPFDLKHPIVLSAASHFTHLVIHNAHCNTVGHCGVQATLNVLCQRFWIVNAKVTVRRVISECFTCRKNNAKLEHQFMSDLPVARFQIHQPPFHHVGVDYFGPLMVKVKRSEAKRYGCLFTCMTSRAIHLELSHDLSSSSFINVLRRFVARRGPPKHIYSDNGTNFVGSVKLLKDTFLNDSHSKIYHYLRKQGTCWTFNTPLASHMGGIWERMIRSVRQILVSVMPNKSLTDDDLSTILAEVENIVNSRPLTDLSLEPGEATPLTPNHLLRLNSAVTPAPIKVDDSDCYSRQRFRLVQYVADEFWKRWIIEYPRTIMNRSKWKTKRRNFLPGDIVLIQDVTYPRGKWPLGKITKVFPDSSGYVRTVVVETFKGSFKRPITKLCLIVPGDNMDTYRGVSHV